MANRPGQKCEHNDESLLRELKERLEKIKRIYKDSTVLSTLNYVISEIDLMLIKNNNMTK